MKTSEKLFSAAETLFGFIGVVMILVETYAVLARNVLICFYAVGRRAAQAAVRLDRICWLCAGIPK